MMPGLVPDSAGWLASWPRGAVGPIYPLRALRRPGRVCRHAVGFSTCNVVFLEVLFVLSVSESFWLAVFVTGVLGWGAQAFSSYRIDLGISFLVDF